MAEYINREDVLKCLEYNTIQKPSANEEHSPAAGR